MHVKGDTRPGNSAPSIWYDYRDASMEKRVAQLKKAKLFSRRWYSVIPFFVGGICLTTSLKYDGLPKTLGLAGLLACVIAYVVCAAGIRRKRKRLTRELLTGVTHPGAKVGEVKGKAVMFSFDPAWEELDRALQELGLTMVWLLDPAYPARNKIATPALSSYLVKTYMARHRLRIRLADPEQRAQRGHDTRCTGLRMEIRTEAVTTAKKIVTLTSVLPHDGQR